MQLTLVCSLALSTFSDPITINIPHDDIIFHIVYCNLVAKSVREGGIIDKLHTVRLGIAVSSQMQQF